MRKLRLIKIKDLAEGPTITGRIEIQTQAHEHSTLLRPREKLEEAQLGFQLWDKRPKQLISKEGASPRGEGPCSALSVGQLSHKW